jgi:hypothetical protein
MNPNNLSAKQRLLVFMPLCWISIVVFFSWDVYSGFNAQLFFAIGVLPVFLIGGFWWVAQGLLKERPTLLKDLGNKILALIKCGRWAQLLGVTFGYLLSKIFGYSFGFPLIGFLMGLFLIAKVDKKEKYSPHIRMAFAILTGHTFWMLIGLLYIDGGFTKLWLDLTLMIGVLAGLLMVPNSKMLRSISVLLQMAALAYNLSQFSEINPSQGRALIVHVFLRSGFIFYICRSLLAEKIALRAVGNNHPPQPNPR